VLTFSLDPGIPPGLAIDPLTGRLTWTPTAGQVPSTNLITVRVTDNGMPNLNATRTFTIIAAQGSGNHPPVLGTLNNQTVLVGATISFTVSATDPDAGQMLTFSLDADAPAGASINNSSGLFTWTPTNAPLSTNVPVRVTDNGTPALSASGSFTVTVVPMSLTITNDGASLTLTCQAVPGRHYKLEYADALATSTVWEPVSGYADVTASGNTLTYTLPAQTTGSRFYHVQLLLP
jgi:hypothetical protein